MKIRNLIIPIATLFFFALLNTADAQTPLTSCGVISSSGSYILQNDVSSPDTCFEITTSDVSIDLNGHTIRFADRANNHVLPNFNFESGSGSNANNWDQTSAPDAIRTSSFPSIRDQWVREEVGSYVMKFDSPNSAQYVYSEEITTSDVEPGTIHILSIVMYAHYDDILANRVRGWMVDKNGNTFCTSNFGDTGTDWHYAQTSDRREFYAAYDCSFAATADQYPLKVRLGVTGALGSGRSAYFDAIEVKPGNDYKFASHSDGVSKMVGIRTSGEGTARNNIHITNGNIIQGNGKAYYPRGTFLRGSNIEIDNVNVELYGPDASGIYMISAPNYHIHHNEVTLNASRTHYSHQGWVGAIQTDYSDGSPDNWLRINDNIIHRSPAAGIRPATDYVEIYNNTINLEVSAIHCYSIFPRGDHYRIYNNVIQNNYGSGIFLENVEHVELYGNYVEVSDVPHEDYEWTGKALWARYTTGDYDIHDNVFIGYAGSDHPVQHMPYAISTVRLGGSSGALEDMLFYNNVVEAYTDDLTTTYHRTPPTYAVALDFNMDGDSSHYPMKYFTNNTFRSNHILNVYGGDYSNGRGGRLKDNKFVRVDSVDYPAADDFTTIFFDYSHASSDNEMLDTYCENGADVHDINMQSTPYHDAELDIKWTLVTMVRGSNGQCINGANVSIHNDSGLQGDVSGSTSGGGSYLAELLDTRVDRNNGGIITLPDYSITASYGGSNDTVSVTLDSRRTVYVDLPIDGSVTCQEPIWNPGADESSAPMRSNGQPAGTLPVGTTQTTISLSTNENATCRYSSTAGVAYDDMSNTFSNTGGTTHSTLVTGLEDGQTYSYYVRCEDGEGNQNTYDYLISFGVATPDTTAPNRFNGQPTGTIPSGSVQTSLSLETDEDAVCAYSTTPGTPFDSMTEFTNTGGTSHDTIVTGLVNGESYTFYVRCEDTEGNQNTTDFIIEFTVDTGPDSTPPGIIDWGPRDPLSRGTVEADIFVETSEMAVCRYSEEEGTQYANMIDVFTTRNGLTHTARVTGLRDDSKYSYYVRCKDFEDNVNVEDFVLKISVSNEIITTQITEPGAIVSGGCGLLGDSDNASFPIVLLLIVITAAILIDRRKVYKK